MRRFVSSFVGPRFGRLVLVLLGAAACAGCGGRGAVSGKVTVNGKPLAAGTVIFHPAKGEPTLAWIGEDGTYRAENVPTGRARVSVGAFTRQPDGFRLTQNLPQANDGPVTSLPPGRWEMAEMVSAQYGDPDASGLSCDVRSGESNYDIPLVGTPVKKRSRAK
jgi:hypothetical protein